MIKVRILIHCTLYFVTTDFVGNYDTNKDRKAGSRVLDVGYNNKTNIDTTFMTNKKFREQFRIKTDQCPQKVDEFPLQNLPSMKSSNVRVYRCNNCSKQFSTSSNLCRHRKLCGVPTEKQKSFPCDLCDKTFCSLSRMRDHRAGKHEHPKYFCKYCNASFSWRSALYGHQSICTQVTNQF